MSEKDVRLPENAVFPSFPDQNSRKKDVEPPHLVDFPSLLNLRRRGNGFLQLVRLSRLGVSELCPIDTDPDSVCSSLQCKEA